MKNSLLAKILLREYLEKLHHFPLKESLLFDLRLHYKKLIKNFTEIIHAYSIDDKDTPLGLKFRGSFFGSELAEGIRKWFKKYYQQPASQ